MAQAEEWNPNKTKQDIIDTIKECGTKNEETGKYEISFGLLFDEMEKKHCDTLSANLKSRGGQKYFSYPGQKRKDGDIVLVKGYVDPQNEELKHDEIIITLIKEEI